MNVNFRDASYEQSGYHLSVDVQTGNIPDSVKFFKDKAFYLEDLFCVDYIDYLELVYFFNRYEELCRVKVTSKADAGKPHGQRSPTVIQWHTGMNGRYTNFLRLF